MPVKKTRESFFSLVIYALAPMTALFAFHTFLLEMFHFYNIVPWFDDVMHFLGGFVTAWSAYIVVLHYKKRKKLRLAPALAVLVLLVGATAIVGILWEVYEFFLDSFLPNPYFMNQPSMGDTMSDLVLDLLGATVFSFLVTRK